MAMSVGKKVTGSTGNATGVTGYLGGLPGSGPAHSTVTGRISHS